MAEDRFEILGMNASGDEAVVRTPSLLDTCTLPAVEGRILRREKQGGRRPCGSPTSS